MKKRSHGYKKTGMNSWGRSKTAPKLGFLCHRYLTAAEAKIGSGRMSKGGDKRNAPRPGHQPAHTSFVRAESAVTAPYAPMAPGLARAPACGGSAASGLRGAQNLRQCWARARVSRLRRSRVGGDRPLSPCCALALFRSRPINRPSVHQCARTVLPAGHTSTAP
jgi:hypothetical protein